MATLPLVSGQLENGRPRLRESDRGYTPVTVTQIHSRERASHDGVLVFEAPDDETATAVILSAEELGNVRTETMRGFTATEMQKLLAKVD